MYSVGLNDEKTLFLDANGVSLAPGVLDEEMNLINALGRYLTARHAGPVSCSDWGGTNSYAPEETLGVPRRPGVTRPADGVPPSSGCPLSWRASTSFCSCICANAVRA